MQIAIVHNEVTDNSAPDEKDGLIQVQQIFSALSELGHKTISIPCSLDLLSVQKKITDFQADLIFNMVESINGQDRLIYLFPAMLDSLGIPYTGAPTESIFLTTHKVLSKERMFFAGIPTPSWVGPYPKIIGIQTPKWDTRHVCRWIVKSVWNHASIGLDENSLVDSTNTETLHNILKEQAPKLGGACFAEQYIDGREFNLSLLAKNYKPEILPPAEILFEGYQNGKPRIVGYRAKWQEHTFEYHHTPRTFQFSKKDEALIEKLKQICFQCWELFGLRGYARVDFRVDGDGNPWVLEVNINPCLSLDAGFVAAATQRGISFKEIIQRIIDDACEKPS